MTASEEQLSAGNRIDAIRRIAGRLGGETMATIDLYLGEFGFPTSDWWEGTVEDYAMAMVRGGSDDLIIQLDRHLSGTTDLGEGASQVEFLVFISHISREKLLASAIAAGLRFVGADAFVAHEEIEPGSQWIAEIQRALSGCSALVALHHEGFRASQWTAQEVGWVLGRGLPVVPVRLGEDPFGFEGAVQGIPGAQWKQPDVYVNEILTVLLRDPRTAGALTRVMVNRLCTSTSWSISNRVMWLFKQNGISPSKEQVLQILDAEGQNVEVAKAHEWIAARPSLLALHGIDRPPIGT